MLNPRTILFLAAVAIGAAVCCLMGCAGVGAWQPPRPTDGAICRRISGPLGFGRGYLECHTQNWTMR